MIDHECPREPEIVEAIEHGRWPAACSADLVRHAASCAVCRDVVAVAVALREDFELARAEARVPSPGLVWWRAQLRARQRAAEAASRPINVVQGTAAAVAAGLLFTLGGLVWPTVRTSADWLNRLSQVTAATPLWVPLALAVGVWIVIAPLIVLAVLSED